MNELVFTEPYLPGQSVRVINANAYALTHKVDFGDAGGVRITLPPGGEFTVIKGIHVGPMIHTEEMTSGGVREAPALPAE